MRHLRTIAILLTLSVGLLAGCKSKQSENAGEKPAAADAEKSAAPAPSKADKSASQVDIPEDQTMEGPTENGNFYVVATPRPNPIPFQELFSLEVKVYKSADKKELAKGVSLDQVRATMPAHGHGMKTQPKVEATGDATFKVEGMKFHMQGEGKDGRWAVEFVLAEGGTIDQAKFDVQCCRK